MLNLNFPFYFIIILFVKKNAFLENMYSDNSFSVEIGKR